MPFKLKVDRRKYDRRRYKKKLAAQKLRSWIKWHTDRDNAAFNRRVKALVKEYEAKQAVVKTYAKSFHVSPELLQKVIRNLPSVMTAVLAECGQLHPTQAEAVPTIAQSLPQI
jgi:hypothetical protein